MVATNCPPGHELGFLGGALDVILITQFRYHFFHRQNPLLGNGVIFYLH
jgi:hypothetical protein